MHLRLIVHDIRSCHNVGSLLRTADAMGVEHCYFTGFTPYPARDGDSRLPHISQKIDRQIHKTALGAEHSVEWSHVESIVDVLAKLKQAGFAILALEQAESSVPLQNFLFPEKTALLLGREVEGIEAALLQKADAIVEIPMRGKKESLNVVQAAAIAMYACQSGATHTK
jgi:tRNA G18 (ribose-2'-O)-methylase SpoU